MELNELCKESHRAAREKGFWPRDISIPTKLMLIVSELSEAMEAHRCGDENGFHEELADTFIRLMDLCGYLQIDIESEIAKKAKKNMERPYLHGKNY